MLGVVALVVSSFSFADCPQFVDVNDIYGNDWKINICNVSGITDEIILFDDNTSIKDYTTDISSILIDNPREQGRCKKFLSVKNSENGVDVTKLFNICDVNYYVHTNHPTYGERWLIKLDVGNNAFIYVFAINMEPLLTYFPYFKETSESNNPIDLTQ